MIKDFVAVRMRKELELAAAAGPDVPFKIGTFYWCNMRKHLWKEVEQETRVEYLREGAFGKWKGHWLFCFNPYGDPKPYPKGKEIIDEMEKRRRGE